jgi:hypothetical protein
MHNNYPNNQYEGFEGVGGNPQNLKAGIPITGSVLVL